jgi:hypothetical protein
MADFDSALPVRSPQDADQRLLTKIVDYTTPTQGTTVDAQGNLHAEVHGNNPSGGDEVLLLSELGAPNPDGVYHATDNSKPAHVGNIAHTRNATPDNTHLVKRITAITNDTVCAMDVSLHDENGAAYSQSNPIPVFVSSSTGGTGVMDYKTDAAVAANASVTHSYTPTAASTFTLQKISASASGRMKVEIAYGVTASEATVLVFFTSTANPNIVYEFSYPQDLTDADTVIVTLTNLDKQAMDVYSTIEGVEN